jgi:hypothetical protein
MDKVRPGNASSAGRATLLLVGAEDEENLALRSLWAYVAERGIVARVAEEIALLHRRGGVNLFQFHDEATLRISCRSFRVRGRRLLRPQGTSRGKT